MVERRVITLGGVAYDVRPMAGTVRAFEVRRELVEIGFFTVDDDGQIEATTMTPYQVDEVMMRLVAAEYLRPARGS